MVKSANCRRTIHKILYCELMIRHHIKKRLEKVIYADDATEDVGLLLRLRLPWLIVGLLIGTGMTLLVSRFEAVLSREVSLAFFIPVIVYMSGAVATQTETIYVRNLARRQAKFSTYLVKEFILGLLIGGLCGSFIGLASWVWINS
jgi:Mg/Co/Ni transporter MgtE